MAATYVFDAGPLHYFAGASQLEALRALCGDARCTVTTAVLHELQRGASAQPRLQDVLDAEWIERVTLEDLDELQAFAIYARHIGSSPVHDTGEAATLSWAQVHAATAIIDDRAAVRVGRQHGVTVHGTLWLVVVGLETGALTEHAAVQLVSALLDAGAWFPLSSAEDFIPWARENGLLTP